MAILEICLLDPILGEGRHASLIDYFKSELAFLQEETKDLATPLLNKRDHRLREAVFSLDWNNTYRLAQELSKKTSDM
jgi:hypothetical protein